MGTVTGAVLDLVVLEEDSVEDLVEVKAAEVDSDLEEVTVTVKAKEAATDLGLAETMEVVLAMVEVVMDLGLAAKVGVVTVMVAGKETEVEEKEEEARVAVEALEDTTSLHIRTQDQRVFLLSYPILQAILSSLKHSCNSPLIE
jgi:hypothetical protein